MIDITKLRLAQTLSALQIPSNDQLTSIDNFIELIKLVSMRPPQSFQFAQIKGYYQTLIERWGAAIQKQESITIRQWCSFYLTLFAYGDDWKKEAERIYQEYNMLSPFQTQNTIYNWIKYSVQFKMLSIYMALEKDFTKLQQEIESTPQSIKSYIFNI